MDDGMNYIMAELIGGGAAGAASWGVATPFDVVKTRIQASERRRHVWLTIKELYQEGGEIVSLYRTSSQRVCSDNKDGSFYPFSPMP